jgi:hypothetical protein
MQKIGTELKNGFSLQNLQTFKNYFENLGALTELYCLNDLLTGLTLNNNPEKAYLLIIRKGLNLLLKDTTENLKIELLDLEWDKKALMKGVVKNKDKRYNLCFGDNSQMPDYEKGKGTVISFNSLEYLNHIRNKLLNIGVITSLVAEGNLYYDTNKCLINMHGDSERNIVIAIRLGESMPLYYQWYHRFEKIGQRFQINLEDGDMYIMSEKAVGKKWRESSICTLRHAAGKEFLFNG